MPAHTAQVFALGRRYCAVLVLAAVASTCLQSFAKAQEKSTADFRAYRLQHIPALQVEERLQEMLGALPDASEVAIDRKTNRVLVRGNAEAQRLAAGLLGSLDRPVRPAVTAQPAQLAQLAQAELKTYSLPSRELDKTARQLQQRYKNLRGVSISSDPRTRQLLVTAPPAVHADVVKQLAPQKAPPAAKQAARHSNGIRRVQFEEASDLENEFEHAVAAEPVDEAIEATQTNPIRQQPNPDADGAQTVQPTPNSQPAASRQPVTAPAARAQTAGTKAEGVVQEYRLRNSTANQFETSLQQLVRRPLQATVLDNGRTVSYLLPSVTGQDTTLRVDRKTGAISFSGPRALTENWVRLVQALDAGGLREGRAKAVAFEKSDPQVLRRVLVALQQNAPAAGENPQRQAQPQGADREEDQPANPEDDSMPAAEGPANAQEQAAAAAGNLIGSVQIEFLEGLDVIVVRGHPRDVQRVTEIIADIERLSTETEPTIEILPLRYVGSEPLAVLIRQLYEQVLLPRQGKVNITALGKPNALLLIGREESVKTVVSLVKRLDQPAGPASQFQVFGLKHVAAASAQTLIQEFFANRIGLDTKVLITADVRSNALIIQASPRDLAEVAALIKRIDINTSNAVNELRIFTLQNSLADEMAPILQAAVSGQTATTTRRTTGQGGGGQGQFPGGAQGTTGAGAASSTQKSTMLKLLTLDAQGEKSLKSGILNDVKVTADPRANALIVSAPADSMELLAALIKQLDQLPTAESQLKVFTIVNGDANTLTEMLRNLFGRVQQQGQGQQFGQGLANLAAAGALGQGESPLVPLRFSVDQRTNSIVVSGSAGDLNVVEAILLRLDDSDVRQRKNTVYRLKNSPATAVANAVNEFLRSERQVQQISPGLQSPFEQIEREVVVVPETVSNSLIVSATPRFFEEIRKVVEQLDARPPMVMIQVLIAEVALNNVDEFGIELGLQDSILFDRSLLGNLVTTNTSTTFGNPPTTTQTQTIVAASNTPGYAFNNAPLGNSGSSSSLANASKIGTQGLANFGVGRINNELGFGGMVLSASSESVSMLVRALQECRRLDVLSRPQIMTLDNQPAFIQVGQRVPRITGTTLGVNGQSNAITLENVGLILGVTPRISPDGLVVMEIDATKSDVGPDIEGIPVSISATGDVIRSPRINITTAQTTVSALSGQTVVLGGLIFNSKQQTHRRVPVLSSIPVLGNLFRYDSATNRRTELLIIMTPRVVRTEQEAETIKQVEAARMSWCLADVVKLYGEAGLRNRSDNWFDNETMTVYPDINPTGTDMPQLAPETLETPQATPGVSQPPLPGPVQDAPAGEATPPVIQSPNRQPNYLPDAKQSRLVPTPAVKKAAATATSGATAQTAVYNSVKPGAAGEPQRLPVTQTSR